MNDTGKNIVCGFRELRKFCHQVSLLLRTATGMMEQESWDSTSPPTAFYTCRRIDEPDWWLPYEFCRFFKNSKIHRLLPYIAVNLDDPAGNSPVEYPLLSTGCIVFGASKNRAKVEHWWSRWHCYMDSRKDDGSLCIDEPLETWKLEKGDEEPPEGIVRVTTFAYPIIEIGDCEALRHKVVEPLLKVIEQESKATRDRSK